MSPIAANPPELLGMRLVSRRTGEYVGACPYCRAGEDRFHIWTLTSGRRPAGRYWCRSCGATRAPRCQSGSGSASPHAASD